MKPLMGFSGFSKQRIRRAAMGVFGSVIFVHVILQGVILAKSARFMSLKGQWEKILPDKENADRIIAQMRELETKVKSIAKVIRSSPVIWAEKLNAISDNLPAGVWLNKITFTGNSFIIEGSAIATQKDEMINVHEFASHLKQDEKYLNHFPGLEVGSIQRRTIKDLELADFTITSKLE